ncbi:putative ubiquitin-conjugating enzyme [Aspergillus ruber CBS 135680]|uniref:UBC core domain-containing protein n=1 Tax=Aspergillus ruber (strain CBS 135680) TaxID=1388766 RepID=A0A017SPT0_ASPRC|nr:uncharacterized protein EURHEDRAFT_408180 [Aspergillus ruber CBS 135680]EYE98957.1 hypothetical protein EURHEDRAFT_408180 [Aspergillus ruber CBS 135680]
MSSTRLPNIPSLRKHQLLLEFASLRQAAPPGVYVSLTPGDPTLWSSVLFVRSGPYASAVLRFQIRFPTSYPDLPPLVTFSTDVFHPLIVPLTTYTFSTNASTEDPVSATDEERLSPGGFSLRHGFPHWFGRAKRSGVSTASSRAVSVQGRGPVLGEATTARESQGKDNMDSTKGQGEDGTIEQYPEPRKTVPVAELLDYIRSTFEDESVLDSLALEAAGNPGAWHAWRAHRGSSNSATKSDFKRGSPQTRLPGDWHWDGIWAKRVQSEVEASHSEPMLYGNSARAVGDEMIRFSRLDDVSMASIKERIIPRTGEVHE